LADPLAQFVGLLQPNASFSKVVEAAGAWRVSRSEAGQPFYCAVLEGSACLTVRDNPALILDQGDFVLVPSAYDFAMSSVAPAPPPQLESIPITLRPGHVRLGDQASPATYRSLVGYCAFEAMDAALLVSLLPTIVHVRGDRRLTTVVKLVDEESRGTLPGREVVLARLLEVLLIGALRSAGGVGSGQGLLRGLSDERLAVALRLMHEEPSRPWTVAELARQATLSRSAFFDRFRGAVGLAPMEYLLQWRMALAKDLLRRRQGGLAEVAERVGYSSANTFSVAFTRHVGLAPSLYGRSATPLVDA
jgi:AraC-like DNA-binding protein